MIRKGRYVYVCPSCGCQTWSGRVGYPPGKFREVDSLVDGKTYPSCRRIEQLCYWCDVGWEGVRESACMAVPNLKALTASSTSSTSSALAAGPLKQFSELWAFLTELTYTDGSARLPGKLSLSFESGQLGLCLTDGDTGAYAFLNGSDLELLLLEAEERLAKGVLAFKASRYPTKGRRK